MTQREQLWQCARRDLVLCTPEAREDVFLWEHSRRVAANAVRLASLPEVATGGSLDAIALEAAAWYHDSGWAFQYREGEVKRAEILARPTSVHQRELGAKLLGESLGAHLRGGPLESALNAILRMNERPSATPEAQILCDAESLDEIGNLSLLAMLRRHAWEGKAIDEAVRTWKSQREFKFWEARINTSFHFEVSRRMAVDRLARLDQILHEIARLHTGEDLEAPT